MRAAFERLATRHVVADTALTVERSRSSPGRVRLAVELRSLPGVRAASTYKVSWLRHDVIAGIVLTTLLVPQGMAYAELAGLPAITGLYTTILCLVGYALGPDPRGSSSSGRIPRWVR